MNKHRSNLHIANISTTKIRPYTNECQITLKWYVIIIVAIRHKRFTLLLRLVVARVRLLRVGAGLFIIAHLLLSANHLVTRIQNSTLPRHHW